MATICALCQRNCHRESLAFEWQRCGTTGFAFLCNVAGEVVEVHETQRTMPAVEEQHETPTPTTFKNRACLTVNGVPVPEVWR